MVLQIFFFPKKDQLYPIIETIYKFDHVDDFFCIDCNGFFQYNESDLPQFYQVGILQKLFDLKVYSVELFKVHIDNEHIYEKSNYYNYETEKQKLKIYCKILK